MAFGGGGSLSLPTIVQRYRVDSSGAFQSVERSLNEFSTSTTRRMSQIGGAASRYLTLPIVGGFAAMAAMGTRDLLKIEQGLREVNSLTGLTGQAAEDNFGQLQTLVADLSNEVGIAQETLVGGLYQAISAGVPQDNAFEFMRVAAEASVAGVTDVETAVDGLTTIINAFGLDASDAQSVADSMFATVQGGKTTFEELSASIFNIGPAAAAAGVSFQEVNAGIATLTASGTPTAVATTQLRAALVGLQRPSEDLNAIFQALGYENAQAAIEAEGLGFALTAVSDAAGGDAGRLQELLGSVEAVAAANVIAGTGADKYRQELDRQAESAGAASNAFAEMEQSNARKLERLRVRFQNLTVVLADKLLPVGERIIDWALRFFDWLSKLSPAQQKVAGGLLGLAAAIGPVLVVSSKLITSWRLVNNTFALTSKAVGAASAVKGALLSVASGIKAIGASLLTNPVFLVIAGLVALGAALFLLYKKNERFRDFIDNLWQQIQRIWDVVWETIKGVIEVVWPYIVGFVKTYLEVLKAYWGTIWAAISKVIEVLWPWVKEFITRYLEIVKAYIQAWVKVITTVWNAVWAGVSWAIENVLPYVVDFIQTYLGMVRSYIETWVTVLRAVWDGLWVYFSFIIEEVWPRVWAFLTEAFNIVSTIVTTWWNVFSVFWSNAWQIITAVIERVWPPIWERIQFYLGLVSAYITFVLGIVRTIWNAAWAYFKWVIDNVVPPIWAAIQFYLGLVAGYVGMVVEQIKTVWGFAWAFIRDVLWPILQSISDGIRSRFDAIKEVISSVVSAIGDIWGGLKDTFLSVVNWIIRNVINKFIRAVESVGNALGLDLSLSEVNPISVNANHQGGVIGKNERHMTRPIGSLRSDEYLRVLKAGEGVIPTSAMAKMTSAEFEKLRSGQGLETDALPRGVDPAIFVPEMGLNLNPVSAVSSAVSAAGDFASDVVDTARRVIAETARPLLNTALAALDSVPGAGAPKDLFVGIARHLGEKVLEWIEGVDSEAEKKAAELGPKLPVGAGVAAMSSAVQKRFPWARIVSGGRPGSITATGHLSYHARPANDGTIGRAIDIAGRGSMNHPDMLAINKWIARTNPHSSELIYSGPGAEEINRGRPYDYSGITRAMHYDHVHWALANGGLAVGPASVLVGETARSRPEHITPDWQLRRTIAEELAKGGGSDRPFIGEMKVYGVQPGDVERETMRAYRRISADWELV